MHPHFCKIAWTFLVSSTVMGCSWYVIDVETNQAMCNNYLFVIALPLVLFIAYTGRRNVTTDNVTTPYCVAGM